MTVHRAADREELTPLIELCKTGQLFAVQRWIEAGKPVNSPPPPEKGHRPKTPLEVAIDRGFHSLVQVLLEGGALQEYDRYGWPIYQALRARRFDIVKLLVEHGFPPEDICMDEVFHSWDPQIMEYFIERGADILEDQPFATAFCDRIRTALGIYKRYRPKVPELQEQADVALRHHCKEGNLKWVSLMLWVGADPLKPGPSEPGEELDEDEEEEEGLSALGWAALYEHYEVFRLKPIRTQLPSPDAQRFLRYLTKGKGVDVLKDLLKNGVDPNDEDNGGCSAIGSTLEFMSWDWGGYSPAWSNYGADRRIDSSRSRDQMKAIHLLARHGAKWVPRDKHEIDSARRSLLKLKPDYAMEFVWIMSKYKGCSRESIEQLLRTSTIKSHTSEHRARLQELLAAW